MKRTLAGTPLHRIRLGSTGKAFLDHRPLRLGRRVPPVKDPRDEAFVYRKPRGSRALMAATTYRNWYDLTWRGDQGNTPQCTAYSAMHRLENAPYRRPAPGPVMDPSAFYKRAQELDEWPGEHYDGSSVRGAAKVALENGYIDRFDWIDPAYTSTALNDAVVAVLTRGSLVVGTYWYTSMFTPVWLPDARGTYRWMLSIDDSQGIAGGHAWLVNGVNVTARVFRMLNSWGSSWGKDGHAWLSFETAERLFFAEGGEVVLYHEVA